MVLLSLHAEHVGNHVDRILASIEGFKTGLKERDEPDDNFAYIYEDITYALQRVKTYFIQDNGSLVCRKDAYIYADFAQRQFEELEDIAKEIDERYRNVWTILRYREHLLPQQPLEIVT